MLVCINIWYVLETKRRGLSWLFDFGIVYNSKLTDKDLWCLFMFEKLQQDPMFDGNLFKILDWKINSLGTLWFWYDIPVETGK